MLITINGKAEDIEKKITLVELILSKGLRMEEVVIEQNLRIVPRKEWLNTLLAENDKIEIVGFFGGG